MATSRNKYQKLRTRFGRYPSCSLPSNDGGRCNSVGSNLDSFSGVCLLSLFLQPFSCADAIVGGSKRKKSEVVESTRFLMGVESGPAMESTVTKDSHTPTLSSNDMIHHSEEKVPHLSNHEDEEPKLDASPEEIRSILEVIAATGKFWHDWDELKNMLSFQLKQVLAEYPEAQISSSIELQQSSLSGETYQELVKRLDEALLGFIEGPPFTLQRISEILLNPKSTYRSLSKLALALEKNLLVTSTLTICTDPYPATTAKNPPEPNKVLKEEPHDDPTVSTTNGVGNASNDGDEEMVDAEADEDPTSKDTEMKEEKAEDSTENLEKNSDPIPLGEPSSTSEEHNSTSQAS